jgi:predicted DNA-binding ribbon-helix-helix protein
MSSELLDRMAFKTDLLRLRGRNTFGVVVTMKCEARKRSMRISGQLTSVRLENEFWDALEKIARGSDVALNALVSRVEDDRRRNAPEATLASALRVFALEHKIPASSAFRAPSISE